MILKIFSIHDSKAAAHLPPFFMAQEAMAIRIFSDCINDPKHSFSQHPEDYTLFLHGDFDCDTADWYFREQNQLSLGNGVDFIQNKLPIGEHLPEHLPSVLKGIP